MALQEYEQRLWDNAMVSLAADSALVENYARAQEESLVNDQLDDCLPGHLDALMTKLNCTYGLSEPAAWEAIDLYHERVSHPLQRNTGGMHE